MKRRDLLVATAILPFSTPALSAPDKPNRRLEVLRATEQNLCMRVHKGTSEIEYIYDKCFYVLKLKLPDDSVIKAKVLYYEAHYIPESHGGPGHDYRPVEWLDEYALNDSYRDKNKPTLYLEAGSYMAYETLEGTQHAHLELWEEEGGFLFAEIPFDEADRIVDLLDLPSIYDEAATANT